MTEIKTVPVKSAWASKINWTQAIAFAAMIGSYFGIDVDAETQAQILAGIVGVSSFVTFVMRTWFTKSVTAAAASK